MRNPTNVQKSPYSSMVEKKVIRRPLADPDHHQQLGLITSVGSPGQTGVSHPFPMSAKFGRRPFPSSSVILFAER